MAKACCWSPEASLIAGGTLTKPSSSTGLDPHSTAAQGASSAGSPRREQREGHRNLTLRCASPTSWSRTHRVRGRKRRLNTQWDVLSAQWDVRSFCPCHPARSCPAHASEDAAARRPLGGRRPRDLAQLAQGSHSLTQIAVVTFCPGSGQCRCSPSLTSPGT